MLHRSPIVHTCNMVPDQALTGCELFVAGRAGMPHVRKMVLTSGRREMVGTRRGSHTHSFRIANLHITNASLPRPPHNKPVTLQTGDPPFLVFQGEASKAMAKKRPRATKRRPRAPQPLPKWSPSPSQMHFLSIFLDLIFPYEICMDF